MGELITAAIIAGLISPVLALVIKDKTLAAQLAVLIAAVIVFAFR